MNGSLHVLFPGWLLAALAVILPILIHLWSRGRGRTVPVASLRWFPEGTTRRARRFRPSDWRLLLVRCLLIILIAFALALPRWWAIAVPPPAEAGVWILVEPEVWERREELAESTPRLTEALEPSEGGAESRLLAPGFPPIPGEAESIEPTPLVDAWSWLTAADGVVPRGIHFRIVTLDRIAALPGSRPTLDREVEWIAIPEPGRHAWPIGAEPSRRIAVSDASSTRIAAGVASPGGDVVAPDVAPDLVPPDDALPAGRKPIRAAVRSSEDRAGDAERVLESLRALQDAGWPLEIVTGSPGNVGEAPGSEAPPEILFLLGLESESLGEGVRWVFRDGVGDHHLCRGWVRPPGLVPRSFRVERCTENREDGLVLWRAPRGEPLLTTEKRSDAFVHRYASRLAPEWSGLGEADRFATWLDASFRTAGLVFPTGETGGSDRRAAAPGEAEPRRHPSGRDRPDERPESRPWPEHLAWAAVAAGLLLERRLAGRAA